MGGRARELFDFPEGRSVGGIIGPRVQDISQPGYVKYKFSTQRLVTVIYQFHC